MSKAKVMKKDRVKTIRRSRKKTHRNANVKSVTTETEDNHADNHFESAVDNVNNNNLTKTLDRNSIVKLESRDEDHGLNPVNDDSAGDDSLQKGSARRKCSSVSKGISIEEFLRKKDRRNQLSSIDKLILKNKSALRNLRMRRTRSKVPPAASTPATETNATATNGQSKEEPKRSNRFLWWKIGAARKRASVVPAPAVRIKCNGPPSPEVETAEEAAAPAKKTKISTPVKVEETIEVEVRRTRSMKRNKQSPATSAATSDADGKQIETRSPTKAFKLRNGKHRIEPDTKRTSSSSPQSRKYSLRSANTTLNNSSTFDTSANGSKPLTSFKKTIKQELRDDDCGVKRKRRKTEKIETPVTPTVADSDSKTIPAEAHPKLTSTPVEIKKPIRKRKRTINAKRRILRSKPTVDEEQILEPKPTIEEPPVALEETPVVLEQTPITLEEPPVTLEEPPVALEEPPVALEEPPVALEEPPVALEETPVTLEEPPGSFEEPPVIDPEPTSSTERIVDEAPVIEKDNLTVDPMIDEPSEPPMLSPQAPVFTKSTEDITINSSDDSDCQIIDSPPVILPSVPVLTSTEDPPTTETALAKPDEQLEDTATQISKHADKEFALQDVNTESDDYNEVLNVTVQKMTDDENVTNENIAREPTAAAVVKAANPIEEPKEPVESIGEKVTSVVNEPEVIASHENQTKLVDTEVQDRQKNNTDKVSILRSPGLEPLENNNYESVESVRDQITPVVEEPEVISSPEIQPEQADTKVQTRRKNKAAKVSIFGTLGPKPSEIAHQKNTYEPVRSAPEKNTFDVKESNVIPSQEKQPQQPDISVRDSQENAVDKELILGALGLAPSEKVQQKVNEKSNDTGTLSLRSGIKFDEGYRSMELKLKQTRPSIEGLQNETVLSFYSKMMPNKFPPVDSVPSDKGVSRIHSVKRLHSSPYKNKYRGDEANVQTTESDHNGMIDPLSSLAKEKIKTAASLVVPEKNCSLSIHPNRQCSDVCKYCYRNFGSLDKPRHVAQVKNSERQRKILLSEPKLQLDTCLCVACYKFVDRKANETPQTRDKNDTKRSISMDQRTMSSCVIQKCAQVGKHTVKRKELLLISKKIAKLSFSMNKGGPKKRYGLCSQHYHLMDLYMMCGICKKRLNCYQIYSIGLQLNDLNNFLERDGVPIKLHSDMLLCKSCDNCMNLLLRYGNSSKMPPSDRQYYQNFRKKMLNDYTIVISDSEDDITAECLRYEKGAGIDLYSSESSIDTEMMEVPAATLFKSSTATSATYSPDSKRSSNSSSSSTKHNHNTRFRDIADFLKDGDETSSPRIQVKFGNLNIGKLNNLNIGQNAPTSQNEPKREKSDDEDVSLEADFCFKTPDEGSKNFEKCVSTIQFDKDTKKLWQDLQKPYGNESSFIRHLIMLEKYWRSGALVLAENAEAGAVKYINRVRNRIQSLKTFSPSSTLAPMRAPTPAPVSAPSTVAKTPQKQISKPAANVTVRNVSSTIHYHKPNGADKIRPVQPRPSSLNVKHTTLKIKKMNRPSIAVSKKTAVPSGSKVRHQTFASKLVTPRVANVSLTQYVEMMKSHPRTKYFTQVNNVIDKKVNVPLKNPLPTMLPINPLSASGKPLVTLATPIVAKKSASVVYQGTANLPKPKDRQNCNINAPQLTVISTASTLGTQSAVDSLVTVKLPNTTATLIEAPMAKNKPLVDKRPFPVFVSNTEDTPVRVMLHKMTK